MRDGDWYSKCVCVYILVLFVIYKYVFLLTALTSFILFYFHTFTFIHFYITIFLSLSSFDLLSSFILSLTVIFAPTIPILYNYHISSLCLYHCASSLNLASSCRISFAFLSFPTLFLSISALIIVFIFSIFFTQNFPLSILHFFSFFYPHYSWMNLCCPERIKLPFLLTW